MSLFTIINMIKVQTQLNSCMPIHNTCTNSPKMLSDLLDSFNPFTKSISLDDVIPISKNPIKFIEDALFYNTSPTLAYADPEQKWIIRQHLISLLGDFPSLKPSIGVFTHNDGTEVMLLNANGELPVSRSNQPVPMIIWVHELYPQVAPIVYIDLCNSPYPIYDSHPFADSSSGAATSSYLENWQYARCDLSGLARNLVKIFSHNHPFYHSDPPMVSHPSEVSKMEAMDRITVSLRCDAAAIEAATTEEIENLSAVQGELVKRGEELRTLVHGLEVEKEGLKRRAKELWDESDRVLSWLQVYEGGSGFAIDEVFEGADGVSEVVAECTAADLAAEDVMYALEKAVAEGVLGFEVYMKQVRILAREQFHHRAKIVKIQTPD